MHPNPQIAALLAQLNHPLLPGIDLSLTRMEALLAALGNPEQKLPPVIHVAGTNGKGSTLAFLRTIYEAQGYRVHAYTSPHLVRFNERILVAGREIEDDALAPILGQIAELAKQIPVTFFEATTAAAFLAFAQNPADVVLLETGLGGRLDATNMLAHPAATVITPVDFDHMEFLGSTLAAIAGEKAGIIKPGVLCVIGAQPQEAVDILVKVAHEKHAPSTIYGKDWHYAVTPDGFTVTLHGNTLPLPHPALLGAHQYHNAALAYVVARSLPQLPVSENALREGLTTAQWPARLQRLVRGPLVKAWGERGPVILDGAHNAHAAAALLTWMRDQNKPATLLCGMMQRKDAEAFFRIFAQDVREVLTVPIEGELCHTPQALAEAAQRAGIAAVTACTDGAQAKAALADKADGVLVIAGSLFLAGEILKNHG